MDDAVTVPSPAGMTETVEQLAARAKKSVVVVSFFGRDGGREGLGSGFVLDADGLIATNLHVIGEARPIEVTLADGRRLPVVEVTASDRLQDLAILRVDARELPALPLGDSSTLRDGQTLVAIGNPLGLERSVVTGVLSGRREIDGREMLQLAIPIEQGNSGGPVLDLQGRVHGLLTIKSLKTANLGFAAPAPALAALRATPNPIRMDQWLTIGVLDRNKWEPLPGARWRGRAGRVAVDGRGPGVGGRSLCLSTQTVPSPPYEISVAVRFDEADGAAGLVFESDGGDRHYGFYPSSGELRLSRFDGPDVFSWKVLEQQRPEGLDTAKWNTLRVRVLQDQVECYWNEQLTIRSTDRSLRPGRVGLCKFRHTSAEFKAFRLASLADAGGTPIELPGELAGWLKDSAADGVIPEELVSRLRQLPPAADDLLEQEARALERRVADLRRLKGWAAAGRVQDQFRELVATGSDFDLARGALLIARLDNPDVDPNDYLPELDRIAGIVRDRLMPEATETSRLAVLNEVFFRELGFHGSRSDYGNKSNSYLNEVIEDREGLPITLSIVYIEVARRLGLTVAGLGFPEHFLVRHTPREGDAPIIDVFQRGEILPLADARERVEAAGYRWRDDLLTPMTHRAILQRVLWNLFKNAERAGDVARMLRYAECLVILEPEQLESRSIRAMLYFQNQRYEASRGDVDWVLARDAGGLDLRPIRELARALEARMSQP